jgi:hypothetical protein
MGAARQTNRTQPAERALDRACQAWQCVASLTRADARDRGVHGTLPTLDNLASGHRGRSVPRGLTVMAREMRDAGIPREDAVSRLKDVAEFIAVLTYTDGPEAA